MIIQAVFPKCQTMLQGITTARKTFHYVWYCAEHRCRTKKIFGGAKDFCPNFPKLTRKLLHNFCQQIFSHKDHEYLFLCDLQEKCLHLFFWKPLGVSFWSHTTLGAIFARVFWDFAQIFRDFVQIFGNFAQIFDRSNLLGVRLHPLHPRLLHYWSRTETKVYNLQSWLTIKVPTLKNHAGSLLYACV